MSKLVVVLGATGNQGGSVVDAFLNEPGWKVRGITRDPTRSSAKALAERGVEVVKGDIGDVNSLIEAFKGATAIFAVTDFWGIFADPDSAKKVKPGQTINEYSYHAELKQAQGIIDAASTTANSTLERFVWSSLSNAEVASKGKYSWMYHFNSKAVAVDYIRETHPALWAKTSMIQVGLYATNFVNFPMLWPKKAADGVYELSQPCSGDALMPFIVTRKDTGGFVKALIQLPPGKTVLAYGDMMSHNEYLKIWAKHNGVQARFRQITVDDCDKAAPGGFGREAGESWTYFEEFGYAGGEDVIHPKDLGVPVSTTSMETFVKNADWSEALKGDSHA